MYFGFSAAINFWVLFCLKSRFFGYLSILDRSHRQLGYRSRGRRDSPCNLHPGRCPSNCNPHLERTLLHSCRYLPTPDLRNIHSKIKNYIKRRKKNAFPSDHSPQDLERNLRYSGSSRSSYRCNADRRPSHNCRRIRLCCWNRCRHSDKDWTRSCLSSFRRADLQQRNWVKSENAATIRNDALTDFLKMFLSFLWQASCQGKICCFLLSKWLARSVESD